MVINGTVSPDDQVKFVPPEAFKVTLPPVQKVVGPLAVMVGVAGKALTAIIVAVEAALWHPLALDTITV